MDQNAAQSWTHSCDGARMSTDRSVGGIAPPAKAPPARCRSSYCACRHESVTVMGQMVNAMTAELKPGDKCPETTISLADMEKHLEGVKWNLWHGNGLHALQRVDDMAMLDENLASKPKLLKAV